MPVGDDTGDEDLIALLAAGQQEALGPLYGRYASLIFNMAAQSIDRTAAEDIVQEVFLTVWRHASTFDRERGPLRPWLLQTAIESLPPTQRQALSLAFFKDLTHDQVATELALPLGTAKTRIRSGIQKLRVSLAPLGVAALLAGALGLIGFRYREGLAVIHRDDLALTLVTSSDTQAMRLTGVPGVSQTTHAVYRSQAGVSTVVVTMEHFAAPSAGHTYQIWVHVNGVWVSLGTFNPDKSGSSRMIAQAQVLATPPDRVEITLEPTGGSGQPSDSVVVVGPER